MNPSPQSLRIFIEILDQGSLSAAANALGLTQPAISSHLKTLEDGYHLKLVSRTRPVQATPAGCSLAEHARRVLDAMEELDRSMHRHLAPYGRLRVGSSTVPAEFLLPSLIVAFQERYPTVEFELEVADTADIIRTLLDHRVELAIVGGPVDSPALDAQTLMSEHLSLVISATHPLAGQKVTLNELNDLPIVLRERGSSTRRTAQDAFASMGVQPRVVMELGSNAAVLGAVTAGSALGVLPDRSLAGTTLVRPVTVEGLDLVRSFELLVPRGRPLSPAAEAFRDACLTCPEARAYLDGGQSPVRPLPPS